MIQANNYSVHSFRLCLEDLTQVLQAEQPIQLVETMLLAQLDAPVRLLRWAIVKIDPPKKDESGSDLHGSPTSAFWCEGAYLGTRQ